PRRAGRARLSRPLDRSARRCRLRRDPARPPRRVVGRVTPLALAAGAGCGLGVVLVILGLRGTVSTPHRRSTNRPGERQAALRRLGIAAGAALVVGVATRWPVGGLLAGVLVASWRSLFGQKAAMAAEIDRIEAIAA